jgi:hypothetical protein
MVESFSLLEGFGRVKQLRLDKRERRVRSLAFLRNGDPYSVMSLICVAIYQVFPNGSVTAELRSP